MTAGSAISSNVKGFALRNASVENTCKGHRQGLIRQLMCLHEHDPTGLARFSVQGRFAGFGALKF